MEKLSLSRCLLLAALACGGAPARAAVVLINDGLAPPEPQNVIDATDDYADDDVRVRNANCGTPADPAAECLSFGPSTRVEIVAGGFVGGDVIVQETSAVDVTGGAIGGTLLATFGSVVTLDDGSADGVAALQGAWAYLRGGAVTGSVTGRHSSVIALDGSSVELNVVLFESSQLRLFQGSAGTGVFANDDSSVEIFGGDVGGSLAVYDTAHATLHGRDFRLDGIRVPPGLLTATSGVLTGTLDDGEPLDVDLVRDAGAQVELVPEPNAVLAGVAALATAAVRRARKRRPPRALR